MAAAEKTHVPSRTTETGVTDVFRVVETGTGHLFISSDDMTPCVCPESVCLPYRFRYTVSIVFNAVSVVRLQVLKVENHSHSIVPGLSNASESESERVGAARSEHTSASRLRSTNQSINTHGLLVTS